MIPFESRAPRGNDKPFLCKMRGDQTFLFVLEE